MLQMWRCCCMEDQNRTEMVIADDFSKPVFSTNPVSVGNDGSREFQASEIRPQDMSIAQAAGVVQRQQEFPEVPRTSVKQSDVEEQRPVPVPSDAAPASTAPAAAAAAAPGMTNRSEFTITLDKKEQLGLIMKKATLEILSIKDQSAVWYYNQSCQDSNKQLRPGDTIIEVNGVRGDPKKLLSHAIASTGSLALTISRPC
mmetsp:Transcript_46020/g.99948  ORF Transcript_46020/g.99948 Transcript_46020/m.99948 type:complete len:200 (-) Transcript_46020:203-802(-)